MGLIDVGSEVAVGDAAGAAHAARLIDNATNTINKRLVNILVSFYDRLNLRSEYRRCGCFSHKSVFPAFGCAPVFCIPTLAFSPLHNSP
jgi:hypothetical protein